MFTRRSRHPGRRGGDLWWLAVLGVALVAGGVALPQVPARAPDQQMTSSTRAEVPFVVAPGVRFEKARSAGSKPPERHAAKPAAAAGVPRRVVVARLGVDAPVIAISPTSGVLVPPSDPHTLGWWSGGARPGAVRGGALITGHTVHTGGGVFDDLGELRAGDEVLVRTRGGVLEYAVSGISIYRKASLARDAGRVFSQSVPGRLVLVTCEDWDGRVYLSNTVVFADLVDHR